ncbi:MAG: cobyric acid synthase [Thermodesulfobacteriota bacterium]
MAIEINPKRARTIMVQGTASHAGKTIITTALCRIFRDMGLRTAPFKAQNMALNAFVTAGGGEIGVAQALQARAAGISPTVDMNPLLLKPTGDAVSQVIIHGRVHGTMSAVEYHGFKGEAMAFVEESFSRLAAEHDVVVLEGAGSPAEINLRENDIANMGVASMTDSPVVLVGDIDRGGVFASIVGTMELLEPHERDRIKAFIINKFRGDISLLQPGLDFLTGRTGIETLGVIPYMEAMNLPDEDGVALERAMRCAGEQGRNSKGEARVRIVVIKLPRISNFTDFDPLREEPHVSFEFVVNPEGIEGADMVVVPGSKNTQSDLKWLADRGFARALGKYRASGGNIMGICGGFQILGRSIRDPHGVESATSCSEGLGFLDIETTLCKEKSTFNVEARPLCVSMGREVVKGFEIHTGESTPSKRPLFTITRRGEAPVEILDGALSEDGRVRGTYIHGLFHNEGLRQSILAPLASARGLPYLDSTPYEESLEQNLNTLAMRARESLNMERLLEIMGIS